MMWYDIVLIVCTIILAIFAIVFSVIIIVICNRRPKIMYVEDGSLNNETIRELKDKGYTVITYRQGSRLPEVQK